MNDNVKIRCRDLLTLADGTDSFTGAAGRRLGAARPPLAPEPPLTRALG